MKNNENIPGLILRVDFCLEFLETIFESIPQIVVGGLFLTLGLLQSRSCGTHIFSFFLFILLFSLVFIWLFVFVEERWQVLVLAFSRLLLIEALKFEVMSENEIAKRKKKYICLNWIETKRTYQIFQVRQLQLQKYNLNQKYQKCVSIFLWNLLN